MQRIRSVLSKIRGLQLEGELLTSGAFIPPSPCQTLLPPVFDPLFSPPEHWPLFLLLCMKWECKHPVCALYDERRNQFCDSPFQNRLENPHVISKSQVFIGVVPKGPEGYRLSSSYENRSSQDYVKDMGNAIVQFCSVVPDGVLVFFPSYGVMQQCIDAWKKKVSLLRILFSFISFVLLGYLG